jgi:diketogulonate reductase-like aldo/keto reductase
MKYLRIGDDWLPALGLGTYQLSGDVCRATVERALELGYRHIDTAERYRNEKPIGEALRGSGVPRRELWVTGKVWLENLGSERVTGSVSKSLERLGVGQLDLLLVHWPSEEVPLEETMNAMRAAVDRRLTRHIGVSNFTRSQLSRALRVAPVSCNQVEYHPFLSQKKMVDFVDQNELVLVAYCPLARGRVMTSTRLHRMAASHGKTAAQVALAWLMQQDRVAAIPKASSPEHLAQNLDVFDFKLGPEEMKKISGLQRGQRLIDPEFAPAWGT